MNDKKHSPSEDYGMPISRPEALPPVAEANPAKPADPKAPRQSESDSVISRLQNLVQEIVGSRASEQNGAVLPKLDMIRRELKEMDRQSGLSERAGIAFAEEIERAIVERMGAFQRAIFKSMMTLCSNVLDNSREIERLNCIIDSLPETKKRSIDIARIVSNADAGHDGVSLSVREREILAQLLWGKSNKEISVDLSISDKTVKNHLWKIYRKLGVDSRAQLFHKLIS